MNVASLEICKELYELSAWDETPWHHCYEWDVNGYRTGEKSIECQDMIEMEEAEKHIISPAYDLGYLLRKLPATSVVAKSDHRERYAGWVTDMSPPKEPLKNKTFQESDTPEDAAAKLAIELFKQGVLTRDGE